MKQSDNYLADILARFWAWAGYHADDFARERFRCPDEKEPFYFPELEQLRMLCYACECGEISDSDIEDYLTCMALDNEEEYILDHCAEHASVAFVERIACAALTHPQWHARWQIAELLRRRDIPKREALLSALSRDPHAYVRQRAKNTQLHV